MTTQKQTVERANFNGIGNRIVNIYNNAKQKTLSKEISFNDLLTYIRDGYKPNVTNQIKELRNIVNEFGKKDKRVNKIKLNLPCVTLSVNSKNRDTKQNDNDKFIKHTGIYQIDIDNIPTNQINQIKEELCNLPFTYFCFISPSGNGLKLGVYCDVPITINESPTDKHKSIAIEIINSYEEIVSKYNLIIDKAPKDLYRLCYLSYDPNIYVNDNVVSYNYVQKSTTNNDNNNINTNIIKLEKAPPKAKETVKNNNSIIPNGINLSYEEIANILYENTLKEVLQSISNMPLGTKHNTRITKTHKLGGYVGAGVVTETKAINDIIDVVMQTTNDKDLAIKDIKDGLNKGMQKPFNLDVEVANWCGITLKYNKQSNSVKERFEITNKDTGEVEEINLPFCFWSEKYVNKNTTTLEIHRVELYEFLTLKGFKKGRIDKDKNTTILIKLTNNIAKEIDLKFIREYLKTQLNLLPLMVTENHTIKDLKEVINKGIDSYISSSQIDLSFDVIELDTLKDTIDTSYFYFQNCYVKVTKEKIETLDYKTLNGIVWESQIIKRDYNYINQNEIELVNNSIFAKFIQYICTNPKTNIIDNDRQIALWCVIGYLLHNYQSPALAKAIILSEANVTDEPKGRTGKGLFMQGIKQLRVLGKIDGKNTNFKNQFAWQSVELETEVLYLDDVPKHYDFEILFSQITEGMSFEKKGKTKITLPIEKSPKIVVSTNYGLKGVSDSHKGRQYEMEFLPYFSVSKTPSMVLGKQLFGSNFNNEEWNLFYNFMIYCVRFYFKKVNETNHYTIPEYQSATMLDKKLLTSTSVEFIEYVKNIPINEIHKTNEIYENYLSYASADKKDVTSIKFAKWLKVYCEINNLIVEYKNGKDIYQKSIRTLIIKNV